MATVSLLQAEQAVLQANSNCQRLLLLGEGQGPLQGLQRQRLQHLAAAPLRHSLIHLLPAPPAFHKNRGQTYQPLDVLLSEPLLKTLAVIHLLCCPKPSVIAILLSADKHGLGA